VKIKKPSTLERRRLPVNCWDWPEANCVSLPEKEEHFAVRLLNLNPNELVPVQRSGRSHLTVIRTHIFRITSFPVLDR
jgi:hypothetical protein